VNVDIGFTEEEEAFAAQIRGWLEDNLTGEFAHLKGKGGSQNDEFYEDRQMWERRLYEGGWAGLGWPAEYGGRPATVNQRVIFEYEYAQAGAPYRVGFQGTNLLGPMLIAFGNEEQKGRFLPRILSGDDVWCQGFSEPGAGSDLAGVSTKAVREGDRWIVNGQKIWTSHAHQANWIYVLCRTDTAVGKHKGLTMLLLPIDQPGIEVRPIKNIFGGEEFNEVFFTDAVTTDDLRVGEPGQGWEVAMTTLEFERGTAILAYQMQFEGEFRETVKLARDRGALSDPVVREKLAKSYSELQIMRYNNLRNLTRLMNQGKLGPESSLAKLFWPGWHQSLTELAMELLGSSGEVICPDYELNPFQRNFLLSRAESIYGGTHQIHLNIVSERLLGLPREPR
jgi:alkylation response protein AidB-like acyl-CoA dehydrogenase